jgi:hypothetical protein
LTPHLSNLHIFSSISSLKKKKKKNNNYIPPIHHAYTRTYIHTHTHTHMHLVTHRVFLPPPAKKKAKSKKEKTHYAACVFGGSNCTLLDFCFALRYLGRRSGIGIAGYCVCIYSDWWGGRERYWCFFGFLIYSLVIYRFWCARSCCWGSPFARGELDGPLVSCLSEILSFNQGTIPALL